MSEASALEETAARLEAMADDAPEEYRASMRAEAARAREAATKVVAAEAENKDKADASAWRAHQNDTALATELAKLPNPPALKGFHADQSHDVRMGIAQGLVAQMETVAGSVEGIAKGAVAQAEADLQAAYGGAMEPSTGSGAPSEATQADREKAFAEELNKNVAAGNMDAVSEAVMDSIMPDIEALRQNITAPVPVGPPPASSE